MSRPSGGMSRPSGGAAGFGNSFSGDFAGRAPVAKPPMAGGGPGGVGGAGGVGGVGGPGGPGGVGGPGGIGGPGRPGGVGGVGGPGRPGSGNPIRPANPPAPAYGWNGYVAWYPAPYYYGGGFWGPFWAGVGTTVIMGEIVNEDTKEKTVSYEVAPDSPGAKALKAYELTQVACEKGSNQVVIYGPSDSVVCASPNQFVSAGEYELNTADLTIYNRVAATPQNPAPAASPSAQP